MALFVYVCSALHLVGTSNTSNVFRIAASDLLYITDIILDVPAASGNESVTVIINVMYTHDYTGPYSDPNATLDATKPLAVSVNMVGFGLSGMFNDVRAVPHIIWNFPFATSLNMSYVGFRGSILAPNAGIAFSVM
jgi:choice-of-anchor A domain-containing protein